MKYLSGFCTAVATTGLLFGCAGDHRYGVDAVAVADCDGFYDDFYGPFVDGCWGDDGVFWYRDQGGHYHRDAGTHFSHTASGSMHPIHGMGPGVGAHFGGDHHVR